MSGVTVLPRKDFVRIRTCALITVICFFVTSLIDPSFGYAQSAASPIPQSLAITIPPELGVVKTISPVTDTRQPLVIQIQDAHGNVEVQKNISRIIALLQKQYGVTTVCLEGSVGELDASFYRAFPLVNARRKMVADYLAAGKLNGAEACAITAEKPFALYGVDNETMYVKNIETYIAIRKQAKTVEGYIAALQTALEKKHAVYSPAMQKLVRCQKDFANGALDGLEYVRQVLAAARLAGVSLSGFKTFAAIAAIEQFHARIDMQQLSAEIRQLMDDDILSVGLSAAEIETLAFNEMDYKAQRSTAYEFFSQLRSLCVAHAIDFRQYVNCNLYVNYLGLAAMLNADTLNDERVRLERKVMKQLLVTPEARSLYSLERTATVLSHLLTLTATTEDLAYFETNRYEFSEKAFARACATLAIDVPAPAFSMKETYGLLAEFYTLAKRREDAFVKHTLDYAKKERTDRVALFTGGYHTDGMMEKLAKCGAGHVVITPRVGDIAKIDTSAYDSIIRGYEKDFGVREGSHGGTVQVFSQVFTLAKTEANAFLVDALAADYRARGFDAIISAGGVKKSDTVVGNRRVVKFENLELAKHYFREWNMDARQWIIVADDRGVFFVRTNKIAALLKKANRTLGELNDTVRDLGYVFSFSEGPDRTAIVVRSAAGEEGRVAASAIPRMKEVATYQWSANGDIIGSADRFFNAELAVAYDSVRKKTNKNPLAGYRITQFDRETESEVYVAMVSPARSVEGFIEKALFKKYLEGLDQNSRYYPGYFKEDFRHLAGHVGSVNLRTGAGTLTWQRYDKALAKYSLTYAVDRGAADTVTVTMRKGKRSVTGKLTCAQLQWFIRILALQTVQFERNSWDRSTVETFGALFDFGMTALHLRRDVEFAGKRYAAFEAWVALKFVEMSCARIATERIINEDTYATVDGLLMVVRDDVSKAFGEIVSDVVAEIARDAKLKMIQGQSRPSSLPSDLFDTTPKYYLALTFTAWYWPIFRRQALDGIARTTIAPWFKKKKRQFRALRAGVAAADLKQSADDKTGYKEIARKGVLGMVFLTGAGALFAQEEAGRGASNDDILNGWERGIVVAFVALINVLAAVFFKLEEQGGHIVKNPEIMNSLYAVLTVSVILWVGAAPYFIQSGVGFYVTAIIASAVIALGALIVGSVYLLESSIEQRIERRIRHVLQQRAELKGLVAIAREFGCIAVKGQVPSADRMHRLRLTEVLFDRNQNAIFMRYTDEHARRYYVESAIVDRNGVVVTRYKNVPGYPAIDAVTGKATAGVRRCGHLLPVVSENKKQIRELIEAGEAEDDLQSGKTTVADIVAALEKMMNEPLFTYPGIDSSSVHKLDLPIVQYYVYVHEKLGEQSEWLSAKRSDIKQYLASRSIRATDTSIDQAMSILSEKIAARSGGEATKHDAGITLRTPWGYGVVLAGIAAFFWHASLGTALILAGAVWAGLSSRQKAPRDTKRSTSTVKNLLKGGLAAVLSSRGKSAAVPDDDAKIRAAIVSAVMTITRGAAQVRVPNTESMAALTWDLLRRIALSSVGNRYVNILTTIRSITTVEDAAMVVTDAVWAATAQGTVWDDSVQERLIRSLSPAGMQLSRNDFSLQGVFFAGFVAFGLMANGASPLVQSIGFTVALIVSYFYRNILSVVQRNPALSEVAVNGLVGQLPSPSEQMEQVIEVTGKMIDLFDVGALSAREFSGLVFSLYISTFRALAEMQSAPEMLRDQSSVLYEEWLEEVSDAEDVPVDVRTMYAYAVRALSVMRAFLPAIKNVSYVDADVFFGETQEFLVRTTEVFDVLEKERQTVRRLKVIVGQRDKIGTITVDSVANTIYAIPQVWEVASPEGKIILLKILDGALRSGKGGRQFAYEDAPLVVSILTRGMLCVGPSAEKGPLALLYARDDRMPVDFGDTDMIYAWIAQLEQDLPPFSATALCDLYRTLAITRYGDASYFDDSIQRIKYMLASSYLIDRQKTCQCIVSFMYAAQEMRRYDNTDEAQEEFAQYEITLAHILRALNLDSIGGDSVDGSGKLVSRDQIDARLQAITAEVSRAGFDGGVQVSAGQGVGELRATNEKKMITWSNEFGTKVWPSQRVMLSGVPVSGIVVFLVGGIAVTAVGAVLVTVFGLPADAVKISGGIVAFGAFFAILWQKKIVAIYREMRVRSLAATIEQLEDDYEYAKKVSDPTTANIMRSSIADKKIFRARILSSLGRYAEAFAEVKQAQKDYKSGYSLDEFIVMVQAHVAKRTRRYVESLEQKFSAGLLAKVADVLEPIVLKEYPDQSSWPRLMACLNADKGTDEWLHAMVLKAQVEGTLRALHCPEISDVALTDALKVTLGTLISDVRYLAENGKEEKKPATISNEEAAKVLGDLKDLLSRVTTDEEMYGTALSLGEMIVQGNRGDRQACLAELSESLQEQCENVERLAKTSSAEYVLEYKQFVKANMESAICLWLLSVLGGAGTVVPATEETVLIGTLLRSDIRHRVKVNLEHAMSRLFNGIEPTLFNSLVSVIKFIPAVKIIADAYVRTESAGNVAVLVQSKEFQSARRSNAAEIGAIYEMMPAATKTSDGDVVVTAVPAKMEDAALRSTRVSEANAETAPLSGKFNAVDAIVYTVRQTQPTFLEVLEAWLSKNIAEKDVRDLLSSLQRETHADARASIIAMLSDVVRKRVQYAGGDSEYGVTTQAIKAALWDMQGRESDVPVRDSRDFAFLRSA